MHRFYSLSNNLFAVIENNVNVFLTFLTISQIYQPWHDSFLLLMFQYNLRIMFLALLFADNAKRKLLINMLVLLEYKEARGSSVGSIFTRAGVPWWSWMQGSMASLAITLTLVLLLLLFCFVFVSLKFVVYNEEAKLIWKYLLKNHFS